MTSINARPKKLRDGSWGALADTERVQAEDVVTITTRAGKTWNARVLQVIWTGNGVAILRTQSLDSQLASYRPRRRSSKQCNCGGAADMMSFGVRAGTIVHCDACGGQAEVC